VVFSPAGLADPVGNVWEWVAQFFGGLKTSGPGTAVAWGSNGDYAWNFQGQAYNPDTGGYTEGLPAMLIVGGNWSNGALAGVRAAPAINSPGPAAADIGFRLSR
jgi:formylglycine-generating enzyme required for sulfatase activity